MRLTPNCAASVRCRSCPADVVDDRLAEWRRMLRGSTTQARAVLQRVLRGRIVFTPSGEGYTFECPTRFDKLFSGVVVKGPAFIEPGNTGWAHLGPEDTFDADYGQLLEAVCNYGLGSSSPTVAPEMCSVHAAAGGVALRGWGLGGRLRAVPRTG
jgi:hypothetical protein